MVKTSINDMIPESNKKFQLDNEINEILVEGTLKGYFDYAVERQEKRDTMAVSCGYAWTKSNHIDNGVFLKSKETDLLDFKLANSSSSWQYIRFEEKNLKDEKPYLIIIRSSKVKDAIECKSSNKNTPNYLHKLSQINNDIKLEPLNSLNNKSEQIELFDIDSRIIDNDDIKQYSRFYILTYEIKDNIISSMQLTMPKNGVLYVIQDLNDLIDKSEYKSHLDKFKDIDIVLDEVDDGSQEEFRYGNPDIQEIEAE